MEPFIGQIQPFGFNFAPRGWAFCEGQLLPISQNSALFSLLGTIYGGDGRTTFALPDLRGRAMVHFGAGPGLSSLSIGQRAGVENVTLGINHLPSHSHSLVLGGGIATAAQGDGKFLAGNTVADTIYSNALGTGSLGGGSVSNAGGGQSFNIRDPYLAISISIALVGIFPSRS